MFRRRPDLIVPIRDRRQHRRYLTLKNFGWVSLAAVLIFMGISIRSEMRRPTPHGYGKLVDRETTSDVKRRPVEVVTEAPVAVTDAAAADPMLVGAASRAQLLQGDVPPATPVAPIVSAAAVSPQGRGDVTIVGGPEGVQILRKERRKPVLSGGFGR
ncbi:MAG: hypothetical protein ABI779_11485 [Acidobacteriota bacterium]